MNSRTWRAGVLAAGVAVVLLLATQRAAGQPSGTSVFNGGEPAVQHVALSAETSTFPEIPESGSLLLLGSAFVVVAQQLRRLL
jgi:hypothetical protein